MKRFQNLWVRRKQSPNQSNLGDQSYKLEHNKYNLVLFLQYPTYKPSPLYNLEAKLGEEKDGYKTIAFKCAAQPTERWRFKVIVIEVRFLKLGHRL